MQLVCCLNGVRTPAEHPAIPVTAEQIAQAAVTAVAAGATSVHLHPKTPQGRDSLEARYVDPAVQAVMVAVDVPVGVTTGAWTGGDRTAQIVQWTVRPDYASVNWHEDGAVEVAEALLTRGIGVEAGCWTYEAAVAWRAWSRYRDCLQVLLEPQREDQVDAMLAAVGHDVPILLHGVDGSAWPILRRAAGLGLRTRIGFEDSLLLPDGTVAADNAELITAAAG